MTRGRGANVFYVAFDKPDATHDGPHPGENDEVTGRSVLNGVLQHVGAELSAYETIAVEQESWGTIAQLAAEYETIAAAAQRDRWAALVRVPRLIAGLVPEAVGSVAADMRQALDERCGLITQRADAVLDKAVADGMQWITSLGEAPTAEAAFNEIRRVNAATGSTERYRDSTQATSRCGRCNRRPAVRIQRGNALIVGGFPGLSVVVDTMIMTESPRPRPISYRYLEEPEDELP